MQAYLEHANITVHSLDDAIRFLQTALPAFQVRGGGESNEPGRRMRWAHIGTDESYIALQEETPVSQPPRTPYTDLGVNHLGFVVDDIEAVRSRLLAAGYDQVGFNAGPHPYRKRLYFYDNSGFEWEFVQYLSDDPAQRNDYSQ